MAVSFHSLRSQHPTLTYRGYSTERVESRLKVTFRISLEPGIEFQPTVEFESSDFDEKRLIPYLHHVGMVELISYWKCACPPRVILEGVSLSQEQIEWWRDLFIHGLGEFFFQNDIDPSDPKLVTIESHGEPLQPLPHEVESAGDGELVLAAGGKDSSLALELLPRIAPRTRRRVMILNPTRSALESVTIAGYDDPIIIKRTIDLTLLALNKKGYLNGHTPFSAYLAFLGVMVAKKHGLGSVIVSNERSASEENAIFHGLAVNHQYSKGERFERRFREYVSRELPGSASYFSLIRPLYDLQVSALFATQAQRHLRSFRSCNVGQREDRWCGECPKCAFVALTIAPFMTSNEHASIFGGDILQRERILSSIEELTGLRDHKPFECVGTLGESRDALVLTLERYQRESERVPEGLESIAKRLQEQGALPTLEDARATLSAWTENHQVPSMYAEWLRTMIREMSW